MTALRLGSLFSGSGMLDRAVCDVLAAEPAWFCEYESPTEKNPKPSQAAARLLAHHYPTVPNLGDITAVDWATVPPVDVLTGGFPCTDVSSAGKRAGLRPGTRSGLWSHMAYAISRLRPDLVVIENVRGLLSADAHCDLEPCPWCVGDGEGRPLRAFGGVCGDLASLGYVGRWCGLRASDVGAPHGRFRVFITATPAGDADRIGSHGWSTAGFQGETGSPTGFVTDSNRIGSVRPGGAWDRWGGSQDDSEFVTDPAGTGRRFVQPVDVGQHGGGALLAGQTELGRRSGPAANTDEPGRRSGSGLPGPGRPAAVVDDPPAPTDPQSNGRGERWAQSAGLIGGPDAAQRSDPVATDTDSDGLPGITQRDLGPVEPGQPASLRADPAGRVLDWGVYGPAIRRWESLLGRPAPGPTVTGQRGGQQLSAAFVEWLMGWPAGWVTDVPGLSRNDQLRVCGNGVVPQQAAAALRWLLAAEARAAA